METKVENQNGAGKGNGKELSTPKPTTLQGMLSTENAKKRFEEILGKKAPGFISSIISATKSNPALAQCDPNSVISSAVIAATLDLPIQNNLGFAAIVPYGNQAQFQMMYRGYIQLAMRTGQYKTLNVCEVYEGELISENRFTGEYVFDSSKKKSDKIIGYTAYFKMINGFEKTVYWTVAQVTAHAKKYSKSYANKSGRWQLDFDSMAKKTVIKLLLSKYGILSVDMQTASIVDQAVINNPDTLDVNYVDVNSEEPVDKVKERIELLLKDITAIGELNHIAPQIPEEYKPLWEEKRTELEHPVNIPSTEGEEEPSKVSDDLKESIGVCETIAQLNEIYNAHPELTDEKEFTEAINKKKIQLGRTLKGRVNV